MTNSSTALFIGIFKSVAGSGVLAMPWCFMRAGWVVSLFLTLIVWSATLRTILQVCRCAIQITPKSVEKPILIEESSPDVEKEKDEPQSACKKFLAKLGFGSSKKEVKQKEKIDPIGYGHLTEHAFQNERVGFWTSWLCVIPCQWVASVAYVIFVAKNSAPIFSDSLTLPRYMTLVMTFFELFLCMPKNTNHLSWSSAFGNIAFFCGTGAMLIFSIFSKGLSTSNLRPYTNVKGAFEAFGVLVFAFAAHTETLAVMAAATGKSRRQFPYLTCMAFGLALAVFVGFSFCVYAAYGDATKDVFFLNVPSDNIIMNIIRLSVSLMLICGYPLLLYPIFHSYEPAGSAKEENATLASKWSIIFTKKFAWRTLWRWLVIITTGVAAAFALEGFGPVSTISGGLTAATSFILPPLFHIRISKVAIPKWSYAIDFFMIVVLGVAGGILSIISGFVSLAE